MEDLLQPRERRQCKYCEELDECERIFYASSHTVTGIPEPERWCGE